MSKERNLRLAIVLPSLSQDHSASLYICSSNIFSSPLFCSLRILRTTAFTISTQQQVPLFLLLKMSMSERILDHSIFYYLIFLSSHNDVYLSHCSERDRQTDRQTLIGLLSLTHPTWDKTCNLGVCPHWEKNP